MKISKYHGLGNDFIITRYEDNVDYRSLAIKYCENHVSIGADGFIVVKTNPLEMVFYNKDGTMAPMCGNGIRAFAFYAYNNKLVSNLKFDVLTGAGIMKVDIIDNSVNNFIVKINMGSPIFTNESIKALESDSYFGKKIVIDNKEYIIYSLFMGTIHTVLFVDDMEAVIKSDLGEKICNSPLFKEKTNVNFIKKINDDTYQIRTFERGVGFTYACGTGACASYVTLKKLHLVTDNVTMKLYYGDLKITGDDTIFMEGSATRVFDTEVEAK